AGGIVAMLVLEYAFEHKEFFPTLMRVARKMRMWGVADDGGSPRHLLTDPVQHAALDASNGRERPFESRSVNYRALREICVDLHMRCLSEQRDTWALADAGSPGPQASEFRWHVDLGDVDVQQPSERRDVRHRESSSGDEGLPLENLVEISHPGERAFPALLTPLATLVGLDMRTEPRCRVMKVRCRCIQQTSLCPSLHHVDEGAIPSRRACQDWHAVHVVEELGDRRALCDMSAVIELEHRNSPCRISREERRCLVLRRRHVDVHENDLVLQTFFGDRDPDTRGVRKSFVVVNSQHLMSTWMLRTGSAVMRTRACRALWPRLLGARLQRTQFPPARCRWRLQRRPPCGEPKYS